MSVNKDIGVFNALDFIMFGLILHSSNINEVEHFDYSEKRWKTMLNGTSIAFIVFYTVLFVCYLLGISNMGLINLDVIS